MVGGRSRFRSAGEAALWAAGPWTGERVPIEAWGQPSEREGRAHRALAGLLAAGVGSRGGIWFEVVPVVGFCLIVGVAKVIAGFGVYGGAGNAAKGTSLVLVFVFAVVIVFVFVFGS